MVAGRLRSYLLLLFAALLPACAARGAAGGVPGGAGLLYVCNQDAATVSIIDLETNRVVRVVDLRALGFSANAKPHHVAVEPDGSHWYVTLIGDNRVVKLDRNDRVVGQATFETPGMLALHPTRDLLFVARSMTAVNAPPRIGMIETGTMSVNEIGVFFPRPHALALDTVSNTVYTASLGVNQMASVDFLEEDVELVNVAGPAHALMQFALSPDRRLLAISAELSHRVLLFDVSRPMAPSLVADIEVERQPFDPMFTPDGRWLYLGNKAADAVTVIDVAARRVEKVIRGQGIAQPHGIAMAPDGSRVYISNNNTGMVHDMNDHAAHAAAPAAARNGTVVVIDTATHEIADVIDVGRNATGIAWGPARR